MVLGHTNCGAVQAALKEDDLGGHLPSIAKAMEKAVEESREFTGYILNKTVRAHAKNTAKLLKASEPILRRLVDSGELNVVAAFYDFSSGRVKIRPLMR